ncbi:YesL family protein [Sutcliffiella sp. NPDC057660]|uniref:YesL family protein n=1 Tax=Sutcliffiella sp. NPDC057660 TaxID=3346199 RepID=UPI0036B70A8E
MVGWEKFNTYAVWMLKVAYLNLLWIGFTLLGLGVLGLFPSTGAMFTIVQKWLGKEPVEKIFSTFWKIYKKEFVALNKFGLFFIAIGYLLIYDLLFIQMNGSNLIWLFPVIGFLGISYILTLLYFFPIYIKYEMKFYHYIKQAFLIGAGSLLETILIFTVCMVLMITVWFIPGIIPFFTGSVLAVAVTWSSNRAINKINSRKKVMTE